MTRSTSRPKRVDPGLFLDAIEQVGVVDVPGGQGLRSATPG